MDSGTSTGVEIVIQLNNSSDGQRLQEDEPTSETQPCKKRKIKVSDKLSIVCM